MLLELTLQDKWDFQKLDKVLVMEEVRVVV
jgi:hypothetical protein